MVIRLYDRLISGLAVLAGLMVAGVFILIVVDVSMRTAGLRPPMFSSAVSEYALLYMTMFAAPWLVRERGHIRIDSFVGYMPAALRHWLERAILVLCILLCLVAVFYSSRFAIEFWQRGTIDIRSIEIPRTYLFLPMILGFGLSAVEFLRILIRGEPLSGAAKGGSDKPFEGEI
jgi:C4-dicarboxylate transporter DctQ subunit